MPNWTYCKLKASSRILENYLVENHDEQTKERIPYTFDFNLLIQEPGLYSDPDLFCGGDEDYAIWWYLSNKGTKDFRSSVPRNTLERYLGPFADLSINTGKYYPETETESQDLWERGSKYVYLVDTYGYRDWYDWRRANWSTKWNACDTNTAKLKLGEITFKTAWAPPIPVIQKLLELHPDNTIKFYWTNEDWDGYHHYFRYRNGFINKLRCEGMFDD